MNLKRWTALAACAIGVLIIASGCGRISLSSEPSPTSPPTRTPRPTFTPRPLDTDTAVPTDTQEATATDVPTDTPVPTVRRVVPTARPRPTSPPQPTFIPPTAGPTVSPYSYLFYPLSCNPGDDPALCNIQNGGVKCFHSGGHYVDAFVASTSDPTSVIAGIWVRFSYAAGGPPITDQPTGGDGKAEMTLTVPGAPLGRNVGNYYAWVVDHSTGNQLSNFSPAIPINAKSDSDSTTCVSAAVAFTGGH